MTIVNLSIYTNGTDTVIAHSPGDAIAVWDEHIGDRYVADGYGTVDDWALRTPANGLRIICGDDTGEVVRSHAGWIAQEGRCFLCSTECS